MKKHTMEQPMVTIAMNTACNQYCAYCPPTGESHVGQRGELDFVFAKRWIEILRQKGYQNFRFTGGEPTLHSQFEGYLDFMVSLADNNCTVRLNTNATKKINEQKAARLSQIRISLDSLKKEKYKNITGTNTLDSVRKNIIKLVDAGASVELIMVLMRYNQDEIVDMMNFAATCRCDLKISDLEEHEYDGAGFFKDQYVDLAEIFAEKIASKRNNSTLSPESKWGIRMSVFEYKGVRVKFKYKTSHTTYLDYCQTSCPIYPCPEGVFTLLIQPDGSLSWCRRDKADKIHLVENEQSPYLLDRFLKSLSHSQSLKVSPKKNLKIIDNSPSISSVFPYHKNNSWGYKGNHKNIGRNC